MCMNKNEIDGLQRNTLAGWAFLKTEIKEMKTSWKNLMQK